MVFTDLDKFFMESAMDLARQSFEHKEVPVGAVIVKDNEIIGRGCNSVIESNDVTAHAEINALRSASRKISNYRLNGCSIFVTLEPCHMCAKAIIDARLSWIIFATKEPKTGSLCSIDNFLENKALNHKIKYKYGLYEEESSKLLKSFFIQKR